MHYYILSYIHCDPCAPLGEDVLPLEKDIEFDPKSKFMINFSPSEEEIPGIIWQVMRQSIYQDQLHIVIKDLKDLMEYVQARTTGEIEHHISLYPASAINSIEFPHEFPFHESGEMPMTLAIRAKVYEFYQKACNEFEKVKELEKAEELRKIEKDQILQAEYKEYLRLKEKFEL